MDDLISRQAMLKHIEKIRQSVQMMDDTHRASITMNGMYLCEKAVRNQPSAQPEITPDGTLTVSIDADIASVGRILLSQAGTQRGGLYYKDEQPEETCDTCTHGHFKNSRYEDWRCESCCMGYHPNYYERKADGD